MTDTYGTPGPEEPSYWGYWAFAFTVIFLAVALSPLWNHMG